MDTKLLRTIRTICAKRRGGEYNFARSKANKSCDNACQLRVFIFMYALHCYVIVVSQLLL